MVPLLWNSPYIYKQKTWMICNPPPKKLDPECLVLPRLLELLEQSIWRANDITFLRWRRDFYWTKWSKVCGILLSHISRYCKSNTLVTTWTFVSALNVQIYDRARSAFIFLLCSKGIHNGCVLPKTSMTGLDSGYLFCMLCCLDSLCKKEAVTLQQVVLVYIHTLL